MSLTNELTDYINRYQTKRNAKPGAIPITKEELGILRKQLLSTYHKDIQDEKDINLDLQVMEFGGIDLYEHPYAKQIRDKIK